MINLLSMVQQVLLKHNCIALTSPKCQVKSFPSVKSQNPPKNSFRKHSTSRHYKEPSMERIPNKVNQVKYLYIVMLS